MSSGKAHRIGAAMALGGIHAYLETQDGRSSLLPVATADIGYAAGTLPDILEPATSPNHRKFLHSLAMAGLVSWSVYRLWEMQPATEQEKFLRWLGLAMGGAYLGHLMMDSATPKSLPLF